ncbi:MAG: endoglucanase [Firmicutes bacterium]|nr:endoglucanase [Bacillota bacterium]
MKLKKPILITLAALLILTIELCSLALDIFPTIVRNCTDPEETYRADTLYEDGSQYLRVYNKVDGYTFLVEGDWDIDMKQGDIVMVLTNDTTRIEVYREYTPTELEQQEYIGYSNGFTNNKTDHNVSVAEIRQYGPNYAMTTIWEREKSTVTDIDYNHYVTLDILMKKNTFSFFIKSTEPISEEFYETIASKFTIEKANRIYTAPKTAEVNIEERQWNEETEKFYRTYFSKDSDLTWGIFEPEFAYFQFDNYKVIESAVDYEFPIMVWYNHIDKEPNVEYWEKLLNESYDRGKILELTLQTIPLAEDEQAMVYGVLQGKYDDYLKAYAQTISDFDHPVLFRLGNEMNGDWCSYSGYLLSKDALVFVEFYQYIHNIFEEAEADNVIWVWNPNGESKPPFQWNHAMMYYPGDEYVDIVGLTAYNTGTYYAEVGETWQTFAELYDDLYADYDARFGQPLMITEFACASEGGDKAQWIRDMFRDIENYPNIKVAIWWDGCDYDPTKEEKVVARSYVIDETEEILEVFRTNLNQ